MGTQSVSRFFVRLLSTAGFVLLAASLGLLAKTTQNSDDFGRLHFIIVLVNAVGVVLLLSLIFVGLLRLVRDYRKGVPGARLKARMIGMFSGLAVAPLLLVYLYSMYFLNRGIDSYFNVDVEQGLSDALALSKTALSLQLRHYMGDMEVVAERVTGWEDHEFIGEIDDLRRELHAEELTILGGNSRIIATSSAVREHGVPQPPSEEIVLQARQGLPFIGLEPSVDGGLNVRAALPLKKEAARPDSQRLLFARFTLADRMSGLASSVQASFSEYENLVFLREPLKDSFKLTLTLVLLVSLLVALWGVIYFARRIVEPIQNLVAGTRAVAAGDFDMRLPEQGRDDVGFLVRSFNDMTRRLADARELAAASQNAMETERASLKAILGRLSTGVVALESDLTIRNSNDAAGAILGVDFDGSTGLRIEEVAQGQRLFDQFVAMCHRHLDRGDDEWREQIVLQGEVGQRVLICACTALPREDGGRPGGHVIVFDDVTALLQAQRDAAWGEVARRLAHEIKNPLTPIQLSAERLRRRYLHTMDPEEGEILARATHTIVQQVEAMKAMVDAFRDYARAPDIDLQRFDLNSLVAEVVDLYRNQDPDVNVELRAATDLPQIEADAGRIRQIMHNLLRNAVEALTGRDGAEVVVTTRRVVQRGQVLAEITVRDNGPGFKPDLMAQVFEPYVTSKPKGTGLGLAIVKKLVEEHAGRITAGNDDNGGAWLRILLPLTGDSRSLSPSHAKDAGEASRERA